MRLSGSATALASYSLPPNPPPEVNVVRKEYDAVALRWSDAKDDLREAVAALETAKKDDLQHIVDMARQGKNAADPKARQRKAEATIEDLRFRIKGLDRAVDEAGNRLAEVIDQHRKPWLSRLTKSERDAAVRFDNAVVEARKALDELRPARGGVEWLRSFDVDLAYRGENPQFNGGGWR